MRRILMLLLAIVCLSACAQKVAKEESKNESKKDTNESHLFVGTMDGISADKVLTKILDTYRGSTVVVDMWATWCGPCRMGHQTMVPLKEEMSDKPVKFVYIAAANSPYDTWREAVANIPGEHYYLTNEQYAYILQNVYNSQGIPTYALYDADGNKTWSNVGYMPNNDALREAINKTLPK